MQPGDSGSGTDGRAARDSSDAAGALGPGTLRAADLLGAQAVLRKPLSSKKVLERVRELLRSRPTPYTVEEQGEGKMAR